MPPIIPHPFQPGGEFRSILGFDTVPRVTGIDPFTSRIAGGGAATITGFNFSELSTVLFGSLVATSVVLVNSNTITCVIPVATEVGLVDISVTTGSQIGVASNIFLYFDVFVREIIPRFGPLVGGTTVIVEGEDFLAGSGVTFGGIVATSIQVIDSQHISCVVPAGVNIGFVDVVVT